MIFVVMEIMSAYYSRLNMFFIVVCLSFAFGISSRATEITLKRVPALTVEQTPAYPENVARYHAGAAVEAAPENNPVSSLALSSKASDVNTAEAALLCDDPTVGYALAEGKSSLLISLSKIENIDSVSLLNRGAQGKMTVSISDTKLSVNSGQWREVSHYEMEGDTLKVKIGPSEAKYVKLTFDISKPGRVSSLGVYSAPSVATFTMPRARKQGPEDASDSLALISFNLTDVHAKSRALYVSSGDDVRNANNMIDDQAATTYSFGPNDTNPTAIIDLGKIASLRRISTVYSSRQGNVDFFVAQTLPVSRRADAKSAATSKTLHLDDAAFADMQMVGSVAGGNGRAAIDFPETTGRYIVVRWTPVSQHDDAFSVAEIAAFGKERGGLLAANTSFAAVEGIESDGKSVQDGKDAKDLGEGKDIPAEAPAEGPAPGLPDPPPFVFVPEIIPTSP